MTIRGVGGGGIGGIELVVDLSTAELRKAEILSLAYPPRSMEGPLGRQVRRL